MNHIALLLLLFSFIVTGSGCQQEEEIRVYDVTRLNKETSEQTAEKIPERMVGAIVQAEDQVWFFKMKGEPRAVQEKLLKMTKFILSLKAPKPGTDLTWKLPEGWIEEPGSGRMGAHSTILIDGDQSVTMAVSVLNAFDGHLLLNINRWRKQVGFNPISLAELKTKSEDPDDNISFVPSTKGDAGLKVTLVNFLGHQQAGGMRPPFAHGRSGPMMSPVKKPTVKPQPKSEPPQTSSLKYTVPQGWKQGRLSSMRKAAFEVGDEKRKVEITVSTAGGDLLANVNMWRQQVQMKPIGKDDLKQQMKPIKINGHHGLFSELVGAEGKTIFIATVTIEKVQWFFKLAGESKLAAKEKERFMQFVKSIQF